MTKAGETGSLSKFLEFLLSDGPPLHYSLKISFLRLLNTSGDQLIKPHNLSLIENLFSKETQEEIRLRDKTKQPKKINEESQNKSMEKKVTVNNGGFKDLSQKEKKEEEKIEIKGEAESSQSKSDKKGKKSKGKEKENEGESKEIKTETNTESEGKPKKVKFMIAKKSAFDPVTVKKAKGGPRLNRQAVAMDEMLRAMEDPENTL